MIRARRTALAALLLASACAREEQVLDPVEIDVTVGAALAIGETVDHVLGTVTIDLALPDDAPERALILGSLTIGGHGLSRSEIGGLDRFPSSMRGGDAVRVELQVDARGLTEVAERVTASPTSCPNATTIPVEAWVTDEHQAAAYVSTIARAEVPVEAPPPPPARISIVSARDLSAERLVAADPRTDDELLVARSAEVARIDADGIERWSAKLDGVEQILAVARGGGTDVVVALGARGELPCDAALPDEPAPIVARLDETGQMAWCAPVPDTLVDVLVTDEGAIAVLTTTSWEDARVHVFPAAGPSFDVEVDWTPLGMALGGSRGDAIVVGGADSTGRGRLVVARGADVHAVEVPDAVARVVARRDGTVGVVTYGVDTFEALWQRFDVDTERLQVIATAPQELAYDAFVELPSGAFLTFAEGGSGSWIAALHDEHGVLWRDAISCSAQSVRVVSGARGEALVALDGSDAVLAGEVVAAPGEPRTIVLELDDER